MNWNNQRASLAFSIEFPIQNIRRIFIGMDFHTGKFSNHRTTTCASLKLYAYVARWRSATIATHFKLPIDSYTNWCSNTHNHQPTHKLIVLHLLISFIVRCDSSLRFCFVKYSFKTKSTLDEIQKWRGNYLNAFDVRNKILAKLMRCPKRTKNSCARLRTPNPKIKSRIRKVIKMSFPSLTVGCLKVKIREKKNVDLVLLDSWMQFALWNFSRRKSWRLMHRATANRFYKCWHTSDFSVKMVNGIGCCCPTDSICTVFAYFQCIWIIW